MPENTTPTQNRDEPEIFPLQSDTSTLQSGTRSLESYTSILDKVTRSIASDTSTLDTSPSSLKRDTYTVDTSPSSLKSDTCTLDSDTSTGESDTNSADRDTPLLAADTSTVDKVTRFQNSDTSAIVTDTSTEKRGTLLTKEKESELMQWLYSGDAFLRTLALNAFMRHHKEPVHRWFRSKMKDAVPMAELDDMKQEFYWRLWQDSMRGGARMIRSSVTGYMLQKIRNDSTSYIRRMKVADRDNPKYYENLSKFTMYIGGAPYYCVQLDDKWTDAEEERIRAHDVGIVINKMSQQNRTALLHQLARMSIQKSAKIMGISDNTVRIYRSRALKYLEKAGIL